MVFGRVVMNIMNQFCEIRFVLNEYMLKFLRENIRFNVIHVFE